MPEEAEREISVALLPRRPRLILPTSSRSCQPVTYRCGFPSVCECQFGRAFSRRFPRGSACAIKSRQFYR